MYEEEIYPFRVVVFTTCFGWLFPWGRGRDGWPTLRVGRLVLLVTGGG